MRTRKGAAKNKKRKRLLKLAKGNWGARGRLYRAAKETVRRGQRYSWIHRRQKKREFRRLWITRLNAAVRLRGLSYSRFLGGLKRANVELNRKILAHLAIHHPQTFDRIVQLAAGEINQEVTPAEAQESVAP